MLTFHPGNKMTVYLKIVIITYGDFKIVIITYDDFKHLHKIRI